MIQTKDDLFVNQAFEFRIGTMVGC